LTTPATIQGVSQNPDFPRLSLIQKFPRRRWRAFGEDRLKRYMGIFKKSFTK